MVTRCARRTDWNWSRRLGFKYVAAEMIKGGVLLGAEESGGIGFPKPYS